MLLLLRKQGVGMIDVDLYFDRYVDVEGLQPGRVEAIGLQYRKQGFLTQEQLYKLAYESSPHSARYTLKNAAERVQQVTTETWKIEDDFSKISLLSGLHGISTPTASYILTALDPVNHAVVTPRVWNSLRFLGYVEEDKDDLSATDYATAIEHVRNIAEEERCTAAAVGYALSVHGTTVGDRKPVTYSPPERIPLRPEDGAASLALE